MAGGGSVNNPIFNSNAWGEKRDFEDYDAIRDPGFLYRGNTCDPYPATTTRWEAIGTPDQTPKCAVFPRAEWGGADEYKLRVRVTAGRSAFDPNRDAPENRQFLVQPFRCTCPDGEEETCTIDDSGPCFAERMQAATPGDDPGTSWRPIQRPGCSIADDGYCRPMTLANHGGGEVTWEWLKEFQDHPDHFPPGTITAESEFETLPPFNPTGRTIFSAGPHAQWTLALEGASFVAAPGLAFTPIQGARFPEPERTDAGAVLENIFSPESRKLRSSFAPPVRLRSPYAKWLPIGPGCQPEPLFDPCVVAACDMRRWWEWTVLPPDLDRVGGGLLRDGVLPDVWFWQRRGDRLVDTYLGQEGIGVLSLGLDEASHWAAQAVGHTALTSGGAGALQVLFVENSPTQARWARLEAVSQEVDRVVFALSAEGELPSAVTSHARLISDPTGPGAVLLDPELDVLLSFDFALGEWLPQSLSIPVASLTGGAAVLVGDRLYVAPTPSSSGQVVNIDSGEAGEWALPSLSRAGMRLTPSLDGQGLLLSGGVDAAGSHDDVWLIRFNEEGVINPERLVADSRTPSPAHATRALVGYADGAPLLSVGSGQGGDGLSSRPVAGGQWTPAACLPPDLNSLAAYSSSQLWLGAGARLLSPGGAASAASQGDLRVGVGASLGSAWSAADLSIGLGAQLAGDAVAGGGVMNHGAVAGQVTPSAAMALSDLSCLQVTFPPSSATVDVLPGFTKALAPGSYARVKLLPRAKLRLRAGSYFIKRFEALPLARVELDTTEGPVRLYVQDQLSMLGDWEAGAGGAERILLSYLGSSPITWVRPFAGTLIAPNAAVTLGSWEGALRGAFFARELNVLPAVQVHHVRFRGELLP
ncbi:MAG: hypothetical protein KIT72_04865 [Polyangiaceae bacterium]|nr:hypothetical protein [Polyangiaceae bacterium]MCW5789735.1 hypothetical protein [Polyangiaceae bacterium]